MKPAAIALWLLGGCDCDEEGEAPVRQTPAEERMLAVRRVVQKLANSRDLSRWRDEVDAVAKRTGLAKNELRWRVTDLVRLHRTCTAVAIADDAMCDPLAPMSVDAASRCRAEAGFYGLLCGRMIRLRHCAGDDAERVATLTHKTRDFVERACREAVGEEGACDESMCTAWAARSKAVARSKVPTDHTRDEPLLAAIAAGHDLSCDALLLQALSARLARFVEGD